MGPAIVLPGFYEVEFEKSGESIAVRALIQGDELEIAEVAQKNQTLREVVMP